jgi:presenilin-like A22 family membrane protease
MVLDNQQLLKRGMPVKHTLPITLIVVCLFLASQYIGIVIVESYYDRAATQLTGNLTVQPLPDIFGMKMDRPEMEQDTGYLYIVGAVVVGTIIILLLFRFNLNFFIKAWFIMAVTFCLAFAFKPFLRNLPNADLIVSVLAVGLAIWKVWRPNPLVHNLTEIFIYGGLVAIFFKILNVWTALMLLLLISIYDMYAVWKSKHMVALANMQKDNDMFAGLSIPYSWPGKAERRASQGASRRPAPPAKSTTKTAVLGGGDMGFPLLFTATILVKTGLLAALVIPPFAALGLFVLLMLAKNDRFYPAMPFISAGCVLGWLVTLLL